jgi:hypothetical protein
VLLVATSIPINMYWNNGLASSRYDQLTIANYLNNLPNTTKVYFGSAFSNLPIYMKFNNVSRFFVYDQIQDCHQIPGNSYVVIPKYINLLSLDYTPNPTQYCNSWTLVLYPNITGSFQPGISAMAMPFGAKLYFVYYNNTNSPISSNTNSPISSNVTNTTLNNFNYFNLTGVGTKSNGNLTRFITINKVSSVNVNLSRSSATPGESVIANITFVGNFKWFKNNATDYYLQSNQINIHYYGTELANQTGMLLDQNNGPWWKYISQNGEPHQILYNDSTRYLRIRWNITPNVTTIGKQLKICGGYFATYTNTTSYGGWGNLFDAISYNQTSVVNSTTINIPSSNCAYLNVTAVH